MKIQHIIEDVGTEKRLAVIADYIVQGIFAHFRENKDDIDEWNDIGKLKDIVPSKVLGKEYGRLRAIGVNYYTTANGNQAEFDPYHKEINIRFPVSIVDGKVRLGHNKEALQSAAIHELRHAMDYSLSKGKAFSGAATRRASANTGDEGDLGDYHREAAEINARASEAMLSIRKTITDMVSSGNEVPTAELKSIIYAAMDEFGLVHVFDSKNEFTKSVKFTLFGRAAVRNNDAMVPLDNKGFRKLFNRMLKVAQDTMENAET